MSKDLSKYVAVQAIHDARFVIERHLVGYANLCAELKVSAGVFENVIEAAQKAEALIRGTDAEYLAVDATARVGLGEYLRAALVNAKEMRDA